MEKFVCCLLGLPNLKTLDILGADKRSTISKALGHKNVKFSTIRELRIIQACHHFIKNCPNLEDVTFVTGLDTHASNTIRSHGKGLKRIAGVDVSSEWILDGELTHDSSSLDSLSKEARHSGWFRLPEPSRDRHYWQYSSEYFTRGRQGIHTFTVPLQSDNEYIKKLRQLTHLDLIEADLDEAMDYKPLQHEGAREKARKDWKREFVDLLKDSPSTDRKVLRWKVVQSYPHPVRAGRAYDIMETEELEVSPETSL